MNHIYENVFGILNKIKEDNKKHEAFLKTIPSVRADLYRDIIFPSQTKFIPVTDKFGNFRLMPGGQNLNLYRGQTQDYPLCGPNIFRNCTNKLETFIARLRQMEFEIVIKEHPAVQDIIQEKIHVSFDGLAQHYGLSTEYLDVTSDPCIAAFFAVCKFDSKQECYRPVENQNVLGVIMKTLSLAYSPTPNGEWNLEVIGLQPFCRPGNQKAYAIKMKQGENFRAHKMLFKHDRNSSKKIYEHFNGGELLFPNDPICDIASNILYGKTFIMDAFNEAISRFNFPAKSVFYIRQLSANGIKIKEDSRSVYSFSEAQLEKFSVDWKKTGRDEFFSSISFPRLCY